MTNNTNNHPAGGLHSKCIQPCTQETSEPGQPSEPLTEADYIVEKLAGRIPRSDDRQYKQVKDILRGILFTKSQGESLIEEIKTRMYRTEYLTLEEWQWRQRQEGKE